MLRVAEQYAGSDTGRQRRANEDSLLARSPLFVVADGMGGAQAGEVASRIAVESFQPGLPDAAEPEPALAELAQSANARIHELSHANAEQAGMGTTLTAVYVGEEDVAIAHVGDSRAYCLRDGELLRLTDDHSLVDELMRQGQLTPEEAVEHPQRSVITRALGPEGTVEVDTRSFHARAGDVYLLCSDGLTTMISEQAHRRDPARQPAPARRRRGADRGRQRRGRARQHHRRAAPPRGGEAPSSSPPRTSRTRMTDLPAIVSQRRAGGSRVAVCAGRPRGRAAATPARRRAPLRRPPRPAAAPAGACAGRRMLAALLAVLGAARRAALPRAAVGLLHRHQRPRARDALPGRALRGSPATSRSTAASYVSGVSASTLTPQRRNTLLDHSLRSEANAASLIRSLELGQLE